MTSTAKGVTSWARFFVSAVVGVFYPLSHHLPTVPMFTNQDKTLQQLKKLLNLSPMRVAPATFLSMEADTCTVQFTGSDLIVSGVEPLVMGTPEQKLIVFPRIGSTVLVCSIEQKVSLSGLRTLWVTDAEAVVLTSGNHGLRCTPNGLTLLGLTGETPLTPAVLDSLLSNPKPAQG